MPTFSGPVLTSTAQVFQSLLEFRWREVSVPTRHFELAFRHDLAIHRLTDRDGAFVEATGRAPLQITATIPFINGISPGPSEHWQKPLYPFSWRKFFSAMADRSTGTLQHPELGDIQCKPEQCRTVWAGERQGGVDVEATWIETVDVGTDLAAQIAQASPLANLAQAAADADQILGEPLPSPKLPSLPSFPITFEDFMRSIRATVDQTTRLQKRFAGQLDNLIYQAQLLSSSVNAAQTPLYWPLADAAERMKASALAVKQTLLTSGRKVGIHHAKTDGTLALVSSLIPAPIGDLISLNPSVIRNPVVLSGTAIRYYLP